mgnify:FL=1
MNINPLQPHTKLPHLRGQFFYPYTLPKVRGASRTGGYGVRAAQAKNFAKAYKRDNQLLLEYVM